MEDWALIRRLHAEGVPKTQIAKRLGVCRNTVIKAVASDRPPRYERSPGPNAFSAVDPAVRALLAEHPRMPATVLAERVGWEGSITWFRENLRPLRAQYAPVDPADRLSYRPGDQVQCDLWFPPARIPLGAGRDGSPPVLVMVCSYSRFITAMMLPSRTTADLLTGMWQLVSGQIQAVPRRWVWDNESGIGRGGKPADGVAPFMGSLAAALVQLKPYDPESKGIVERANGYLETSFLPGRTFAGPEDFNTQLVQWLGTANTRRVRSIAARPAERIGQDRAAMLPLPSRAPVTGCRRRVKDDPLAAGES
ncbi:MAG: IS21 family transposase [Micrococcus sp.]|nr:IS21 family transposase [Micrococcus sp.]